MNCEDIKINISAYCDGELSEAEANKVIEHIENCNVCKTEFYKYKALSEKIKECAPILPEDFKAELPPKHKGILRFIRGHEGFVSAMVAAIALVIFCGGISEDKYKTPIVEPSPKRENVAAQITVADNTKSTNQEIETPAVTVVPKTEAVPTASPEIAPRIIEHENDNDNTNQPLPESAPASGGGSSALTLDKLSEIENYVLPDKSEFSDEGVYNYLCEKLQTIKARISSNPENTEDILNDFTIFKTEVENAKK